MVKPWTPGYSGQTLDCWIQWSNLGPLDTVVKPWTIGYSGQTLDHWIQWSNLGSLDAVVRPWIRGCCFTAARSFNRATVLHPGCYLTAEMFHTGGMEAEGGLGGGGGGLFSHIVAGVVLHIGAGFI